MFCAITKYPRVAKQQVLLQNSLIHFSLTYFFAVLFPLRNSKACCYCARENYGSLLHSIHQQQKTVSAFGIPHHMIQALQEPPGKGLSSAGLPLFFLLSELRVLVIPAVSSWMAWREKEICYFLNVGIFYLIYNPDGHLYSVFGDWSLLY